MKSSSPAIGTQHFGAPWGRALKIISALSTALLLAIPSLALVVERSPNFVLWLVALIPPLILLPSIFFVIRGYVLEGNALLVRRLCWNTRIPLHDLKEVSHRPDAMSRSIRLFGNGGLFSFTGLYRNRDLGLYRAYVTDLNRCVVLRFPTRTVVISPELPDRFVAALSEGKMPWREE